LGKYRQILGEIETEFRGIKIELQENRERIKTELEVNTGRN